MGWVIYVNKKIDIPAGDGLFTLTKKLKCFFVYTMIVSVQATTTTIQTMFSFLRNGDINNSIRGLSNLPGIFTSDSDKIKYALLNHSTAMRANLSKGDPIFAGIRKWEAELERHDIASITSGRLPSMAVAATAASAASAASDRSSLFNDNELRIDNAALAFIMAKELAFLNRTIQMISLIANRYNEEQEDLFWGRYNINNDNDNDNDHDNDHDHDNDIELGANTTTNANDLVDDTVPGVSQLSATFLIASGSLQKKINALCELLGTSAVLVNAMTMMDRPDNEANRQKQRLAENGVISDIFLYFAPFDAEHRSPVVCGFLELRDISVYAWRVMSMFAFSNLFRLTAGTDFDIYQPEDAIFTQGRDYTLRPRYEEAAVMRFAGDDENNVAATADADADAIAYD